MYHTYRTKVSYESISELITRSGWPSDLTRSGAAELYISRYLRWLQTKPTQRLAIDSQRCTSLLQFSIMSSNGLRRSVSLLKRLRSEQAARSGFPLRCATN